MKIAHAILGCALLVFAPAGHAKINGTRAADITPGQELCVVESPGADANFSTVFIKQLNAHGYTARFVKASADCPVSVVYSAQYAMSGGYRRVLKNSTIYVKRDDAILASVTFRFSRFPPQGSVEDVVGKMLDVLLP